MVWSSRIGFRINIILLPLLAVTLQTMKKIFVILSAWTFFYIGLAIIQSCDPCDDGPFNYQLVSIAGEVKRISGIELLGSYQTAYYTVELYVPQTNGVRYDSIGVDIINRVELLAYDTEADFFNSAIACSPATNFESLENITITSSENYIDIYPAGTDLREIISNR